MHLWVFGWDDAGNGEQERVGHECADQNLDETLLEERRRR
jgi:hypothetical protein